MGPVQRILLTLAAVVVVIAGMHFAAPVVNPILLAALLALSIDPLLGLLIRKGVPAGAALAITLAAVVLGGLALISVLGASVASMVQALPTYEDRLTALADSAKKLAASMGFDLSKLFSLDVFNPQRLMGWATKFLGQVLQGLSRFFVVLLLVAFTLIDSAGRHAALRRGKRVAGEAMAHVLAAGQDVRTYVGATALTGLVTAVGNTILLLILGVDFALTWGVVSFLFNFVPNIGFIIALAPPALLALVQFGWQRALVVVIGYLAINFVAENILKPRLIRTGIDMTLLEIFVSLIFWNFVLGPVGAILSVPLTAVIKKQFAALSASPAH